jgi:putative transposase
MVTSSPYPTVGKGLFRETTGRKLSAGQRDKRHLAGILPDQDLDVGSKNNQKVHQWSHGSIRHKLTYKAERYGMNVVLQEESYTSKTCPVCGHRRKSSVQGRLFHCTNKQCGFTWHRDGVGAMNIRAKYRGEFGSPHVVGAMAPPTGMEFAPHTRVARRERLYR